MSKLPDETRPPTPRPGAVVWCPELSTGIDLLDNAHRLILEQIETLLTALRQEQAPSTVRALVAVLEQYATEHFDHEEELMRATHYPDAFRHYGGHGLLKTYLAGIKKEMGNATPNLERIADVARLLASAVVDHLDTLDRELAEYLRARHHPA